MTLCLCELEKLLCSSQCPIEKIENGACCLTGEGERSVKRLIKLSRCPDKTKIVKLKGSQPAIFNDDYRKICDYLIFVPGIRDENSVDIVFCELKNKVTMGSAKVGTAWRQIKCTIPLSQYIVSGLEIHFKKKPRIKWHYVILCEELIKRESVEMASLSNNAEIKSENVPTNKQVTRYAPGSNIEKIKYGNYSLSIIEVASDLVLDNLMDK